MLHPGRASLDEDAASLPNQCAMCLTDSKQGTSRLFHDFPVEILFHCFRCMPLESLIRCRNVCKDWQSFVASYVAEDFDRRRLLELFDFITKSKVPARDAMYRQPLQRPDVYVDCDAIVFKQHPEFERRSFLDDLLAQIPIVPKSFLEWILEWPTYLVRPGQWPAQPPFVATYSSATHPHLDLHDFPDLQSSRMLSIHHATGERTYENAWLIVEQNSKDFGRVLVQHRGSESSAAGHQQSASQTELYDDWIDYQRMLWEEADGYGCVISESLVLAGGDYDGDVRQFYPLNDPC